MKKIKDGKKSGLSGNSLEMPAILYTSAHLEEARICNDCECSNDSGKKFTSNSNNFSRFDFELEKFGIDVNVLQDVGIMREFIGWTKDWEK